MIRVNLACGEDRRPGWINVDQYAPADLQMDIRQLQFEDASVDEILISHALEGFTQTEVTQVLVEARRVLKPNGRLLINVPDLPWVLENWLNVPEDLKWGWPLATVFGPQDNPEGFHRSGFTSNHLDAVLRAAGFDDVRVSRFFSHGQGCLWAQAAPLALATRPQVSFLWSPSTADEVKNIVPRLSAVFPVDGELIIAERWGSASELLAQLEGNVTWLRNADPITEEAGIRQAAMIARSDSVIVIRNGLIDVDAIESRLPLAQRIAPRGYLPDICLPPGHISSPTPALEATSEAIPTKSMHPEQQQQSFRHQLAVAMNTRNEEAKIVEALDSVDGVDELIVGDMQSTDHTVEIVEAHGGRVISLPNAGYCEPGRQIVIDASRCEWVLILDGDERLSANGVAILRELIASVPSEVTTLSLAFKTYLGEFNIRSTGWDAHFEWHQRLFRRGHVTWPETVHSVPQSHGQIMQVPADLVWFEHKCFDNTAHAMEKFNRYSSAEASDLAADQEFFPTILGGVSEGIAEFVRRYNPEVDGAASFVLSFGLLAYKFLNQAKAVEMRNWTDPMLPEAESVKQGWIAFLETLGRYETERFRREAANMPIQERLALLVNVGMLYGLTSELQLDIAEAHLECGDRDSAIETCRAVLSNDPNNERAIALLEQLNGRFVKY